MAPLPLSLYYSLSPRLLSRRTLPLTNNAYYHERVMTGLYCASPLARSRMSWARAIVRCAKPSLENRRHPECRALRPAYECSANVWYTFMSVHRRGDLLHGLRGVVDSLPGASRPVPRTMPRRKRHHRARPDPRAPIFHPVCRVVSYRIVSCRWMVVRQMHVDTGPFQRGY